MRTVTSVRTSRSVSFAVGAVAFTLLGGLEWLPTALANKPSPEKSTSDVDDYELRIQQDAPVAYWRFTGSPNEPVNNSAVQGDTRLQLIPHQKSFQPVAGPVSPEFPRFSQSNTAVRLQEPQSYFKLSDPGDNSSLDFDNGDEITLEAWVNPVRQEGVPYLIGKGRLRAGKDNQNYALRLQNKGGGMAVGFLFKSRGEKADWHRWTSNDIVTIGDGWHHVALTYKFGEPKSIAAYIDGVLTRGRWDMGGETTNPPVVDNDDVWIGSGQQAVASSSYQGELDEVAIYRKSLTTKQVQSHYEYVRPKFFLQNEAVPASGVLVQIYEGLSDRKSWTFRPPTFSESFHAEHFGLLAVPKKYNEKGIHVDRSNPFLMVLTGKAVLPKGEHRLLIRSRNSARLSMDGEQLAETKFHSLGGDNGPVFEVDRSLAPNT
ncbi:MAG TPA: LamG domain-containing protein, partial [Planctomicrobium sp.]|nr:LamG domain-containing protein [Planctomicrobium sp.]